MLGKGKAEAVSASDIAAIADELACHPADLEAIAETESGGFGWFPNGQIKILPEPHAFGDYLPKEKFARAKALGLATDDYKATKASGHYKKMTTGPGPRYALLEKQIEYDRNAAFMGMSVGKYQIMGFNHALCGYASAEAMFDAFCASEKFQLRAFANFLKKKGLVPAIRSRDFDKVEVGYNGGGQNGAYAVKMRAASAKLRAGKWAGYKPGSIDKATEPAAKPVEATKPPVAPTAPKRSLIQIIVDAIVALFRKK